MSTSGHLLPTVRRDHPSGDAADHVHRGGLWIVTPADPHRPRAMTWLPDRLYRIAYWPTKKVWHLQVEDDLRWTAVARIVAVHTNMDYIDMAATPDGTPLLSRHDTYLVRHAPAPGSCRMQINRSIDK